MPFLLPSDFTNQIQQVQLNQLLTADSTVLYGIIAIVTAEVRSHLIQKYDIDSVLTDTKLWDYNNSYSFDDRVYVDAPVFDINTTYSQYDMVKNLVGTVYHVYIRVIASGLPPNPFNPSDWTDIGTSGTIFYGKVPYPRFDLYATYNVGDIVYYNGHTWKCLIQSITPTASIQYGTYANIPNPNVFPSASNPTYWQDLGAVNIPAQTFPTDATKWVMGDNRNTQLLVYMVDMCLYHLHSRIAPTNVPALRIERYMGKDQDRTWKDGQIFHPDYCALGWLQGCANGRLTPQLPKLQPIQGTRNRFGGQIKQQNSY